MGVELLLVVGRSRNWWNPGGAIGAVRVGGVRA
jgi:hypothetical protein